MLNRISELPPGGSSIKVLQPVAKKGQPGSSKQGSSSDTAAKPAAVEQNRQQQAAGKQQ
jgi:hypothetical protein